MNQRAIELPGKYVGMIGSTALYWRQFICESASDLPEIGENTAFGSMAYVRDEDAFYFVNASREWSAQGN